MKIETFKNSAERILCELESLVQTNMETKGNTSEECQKIYILSKIESLRRSFNGTEQIDLKK
jgi:hypothetical protein